MATVVAGKFEDLVAMGLSTVVHEDPDLELLQDGATNAQIAHQLSIGIETVRTHARNIYRKLGIASRRELTG